MVVSSRTPRREQIYYVLTFYMSIACIVLIVIYLSVGLFLFCRKYVWNVPGPRVVDGSARLRCKESTSMERRTTEPPTGRNIRAA